MKKYIVLNLFVCLYEVHALNLPGPLVYVVTPAPKPYSANEGRSAPFYYHNWMRRMDAPENITSTSPPKVKTPDLIFAEFESGSSDNMKKSIRKLLEKEKIDVKTTTTTTTTLTPIYVPDEEYNEKDVHEILPSVVKEEHKQDANDMSDYYNSFNNLYNNVPTPVYFSSTTQSPTLPTALSPTTTAALMDVENIWHIIDNEKREQDFGNWNEVPINFEKDKDVEETNVQNANNYNENDEIDENFALPGFGTNPGSAVENEYRAIRTEPNTRFPYVSLKPFQMKKPLLNVFSNGKKSTNMLTSLDNFQEVKNPVRGEVQDVQLRQSNHIDRYNPAQPYLPPRYGGTSKQSSSGVSKPNQVVANLVPPPPPPPPPPSSQVNGDDFSLSNNYESFPPYPPSISNPKPTFARPSLIPPVSVYQPPSSVSDDVSPDSSPDNGDDEPPMDLGYRYKPPSPPAANFIPTVQPVSKPLDGYSYNKPMMTVDTPPTMNAGGYSYNKPTKTFDNPPMMDTGMNGYTYSKPQPPVSDDKPDFQGYHYDKPQPVPPSHDHLPEYPESHEYDGHHEASTHDHDSEYPELIFDKPHSDMQDTKQVDDTKDMGMMPPPPPPADMKPDMDAGPPPDDNGFPHDFPGDFKYHDFDDHDYHHYHHHHTTTTTTTTEMPRVNRYSYYYLGKKLYYLPLYFSVYFIVYVGALIIKAILRHKIVYPNSWRPNDQTASFFSKRSIDYWDLSHDNLHEMTGRITKAIGEAAEKYMSDKQKVK